MRTLTIKIELENAAFDSNNLKAEIKRILNDERIVNDTEMTYNSGGLYHSFRDALRDINGNKIGYYRIDK